VEQSFGRSRHIKWKPEIFLSTTFVIEDALGALVF